MNDKFTVRDFLVYFLTGLYFLLTLINQFHLSLLSYFLISKDDIQQNSALTIFLLIPGLYLLGQTIHGIDLVIFKIGRCIWDLKVLKGKCLKKYKLLGVINLFNFLINGNRISGILNSNDLKTSDFYENASELQYDGVYDRSEYWNLMNDLFKGLMLISLGWVVFYIFNFDKIYLALNIFLTIIFWYRSRHLGTNYITTVQNTYKVLGNRRRENK